MWLSCGAVPVGVGLRSGAREVCECVRVNVRFVWGAFVSCWFACGCVLELAVCRVRFARVSCPRLRFGAIGFSRRL